ncbi:MAG: hypothetical protein U0670_01870 [Anaerolineae bacterium]
MTLPSSSNESLFPRALMGFVIGIAVIGIALGVFIARRDAALQTIVSLTPTRTGEVERCLSCHSGIEPISPSHSIEDFGCVSCHGGDRLALEADRAHEGMVRNPAALDAAQQYCGECHAGQIATVQRTLMTTYAGAITLIRRSFGQQPDGTAQYAIQAVDHLQAFTVTDADPHPVQQFAQNCLTCHITGQPEPVTDRYRSTGCATCHVLYASDGRYTGGDPTISRDESGHAQTHQFTTAIPYTQCNHCHNRGNYDLRTMTFVPRADMPYTAATVLEQRAHDYYQPIAQFTLCEWELDCVDCHTSHEVMGDAVIYSQQTQSRYVECRTCHGTPTELPREAVVASEDEIAMTRANLNPNISLAVGDTIMVTDRGEPLYHIQHVDDQWVLTGKVTGISYPIPLVQGSTCQQDPNDQSSASCHQCHTYDRSSTP